jgi:predicted glycogen debranching enzyme
MCAVDLKFDRAVCGDIDAATEREWLETNGIGGFSSSTIAGLNTRRYHGLLTAATKPPLGRMVLLSKLEETLVISGQRFELSANQYSGAFHPRGHELLAEFRLDPFPVSTYEVAGRRVTRTLFMPHGENTVVIEYAIERHAETAEADCELEIRPLIAFRDYHATTHANDSLDPTVLEEDGVVSVAPYQGLPRLYLAHNAASIEPRGHWYYGFEYTREKERGLDSTEDLFNPFTLRFSGSGKATIVASTLKHAFGDAAAMRACELERRSEIGSPELRREPLLARLAAAADQFIVDRGKLKSVVAGYHWFGDWGRDTMIALPGLTLATGRPEAAKSVLSAFAGCVSQGMLPNRFPDDGDAPEYNTVDATLWFFEAIRAYEAYTGDIEFVRGTLYSVLRDIADWHMRGTRYGIRVDDDGLLMAGVPGVQLTWMDARIGDWVVTPRHGKPVEIQALWYNALRILENLAERFHDEAARLIAGELADLAKRSFNAKFWNEEAGCLYDAIDGDDADGAIRPNQVFAASLHYAILAAEKTKPMLDAVERELLTPFGLRTLSPRDSRYRPHYEGGVWERDSAYHQGTVWPWLMGPFISAYVRLHGRFGESRSRAQAWLEGFSEHLRIAGLGQVSEILDAEPPHRPRGCIAQAWSVAELLRAAAEDVYELKPAPIQAATAHAA